MSTSSRTVLCHGVFDVLHPGHLAHLEAARSFGDRLVVSITADEFVNKGPGRPILNALARAEMLRALRVVDEVFICNSSSAVPAIERYHPWIYAKGWEYKTQDVAGNLQVEEEAVGRYGGRIAFTNTPRMSSSALINATEANDHLRYIRTRLKFSHVEQAFAAARETHWSVAGERIQDVYTYVMPALKAPKDNLVAFVDGDSERWAGGISVIAANVSAYTGGTTVFDGGLPSIVKRRFVEKAFNQKVFHDVIQNPGEAPKPFDVSGPVIVGDFGHGLWPTATEAQRTAQQAGWLGLTVQSNSLNWGFNVVTKWPRADYLVCDLAEAQLALHERVSAEDAIVRLRAIMGAKVAIITTGHKGCVVADGAKVFRLPALSKLAVDRMGAGDAFLAWSAPFIHKGVDAEIAAFIASCAAAIKVSKRGNPSLTKAEVMGMAKAVLA